MAKLASLVPSLMDRMPQELLELVVQDLPKNDLMATRQVNKPLSCVSTPLFFHTVPLWIGKTSLERLTQISKTPHLAACVKTIVFSPLQFRVWEDNTAHTSQVCALMRHESPSETITLAKATAYMSTYQKYLEDQSHLIKDGLAVTVLTEIFKQLHLTSLFVDWHDFYLGSKELIDSFGLLVAADLLSFEGHGVIPILFKALAASGTSLCHLHLGNQGELPHDNMPSMIDNRLRGESPGLLVPWTAFPISLSAKALMVDKSDINSVLEGLRELVIETGDFFDDIPADDMTDLSTAIGGLVEDSKSLRSFYLGLIEDGPKTPLNGILLKINSNQLRKAVFMDAETSADGIVSFITKHATTLEDVTFKHTTITPGDCQTIGQGLKRVDLGCLKNFHLYACGGGDHEGEYDVDMQDYLLHMTDEDPVEGSRK